MNLYYCFLIGLVLFISAAYVFIAIVQFCRKIALRHDKIMQEEEEADTSLAILQFNRKILGEKEILLFDLDPRVDARG